ncbi:MAG: SxtJ family membrane protein [Acidobacteriota bacterium]
MSLLKKLYAAWMKLAHALGWVNTRILLFVFFVVVLGPFALLARLFRKDFYEQAVPGSPSYWIKRPVPGFTKEDCHRQF